VRWAVIRISAGATDVTGVFCTRWKKKESAAKELEDGRTEAQAEQITPP
jgi:hypothetical protein